MRNPIPLLALSSVVVLAACSRSPAASDPSSAGIPPAVGSRQPVSLPLAGSAEQAPALRYAALGAEPRPLSKPTNDGRPDAKSESRQEAAASIAGHDLNFIQRFSNDGQATEQAALYVASKTGNTELRDYAARMGQELGKANAQLRKIAARRSIETPADPVGVLREKLDQLRQLSGLQMDQAFLRDFGTGASKDSIALLEEQASQSGDKELRAFVAKQLPQVRQHYKRAKALQETYPTSLKAALDI